MWTSRHRGLNHSGCSPESEQTKEREVERERERERANLHSKTTLAVGVYCECPTHDTGKSAFWLQRERGRESARTCVRVRGSSVRACTQRQGEHQPVHAKQRREQLEFQCRRKKKKALLLFLFFRAPGGVVLTFQQQPRVWQNPGDV